MRLDNYLYSCCSFKHGYSIPELERPYVQLTFVSVQRTAQTSYRMFPKTRIMVDDVKFNGHSRQWHRTYKADKQQETNIAIGRK